MWKESKGTRGAHNPEVAGSNPSRRLPVFFHLVTLQIHSSSGVGVAFIENNP
jgi:hypothetical protein